MAIDFNGTDQALVGTVVNITDQFTICLRLRTTFNTGNRFVFGAWDSGNVDQFSLRYAGSNVWEYQVAKSLSGLDNDQAEFTSSTLRDGSYHDVVLTRDGATIAAYVDATAQTLNYISNTLTAGTITMTQALNYGCLNNGGTPTAYFDGDLADIRVFQRLLSGAEIQDYTDGDLTSTTNLVYWYKTCDGALATDSSGNGNNGTLVGSPAFVANPSNAAACGGGGSAIAALCRATARSRYLGIS